jgi:hypothetical protein
MKTISKILKGSLDFTPIAETFISDFSEITTIFGGRNTNGKVWIKV